jgi:hypothetical protein
MTQKKPMNVHNFTKDLSVLLRKISKIRGSHLKTHSFTAMAITETLVQKSPEVTAVIEHKNIVSSDTYNWNSQTEALKKKNNPFKNTPRK